MIKNIAAVVVTYNRLDLLKKVIAGLRNQTQKIDKIFVVNNSSTDGTAEWLAEQNDLEIINQENLGSSGGQYSGALSAFNAGFEWIWQMDDDVISDEKCLENLMKFAKEDFVVVPKRMTPEGEVFYNDTKEVNMTNPFKSIWTSIVSESDFVGDTILAEGITFEGPLFHRSIFERVGFAEKKFFITGDDTEYSLRLKKIGVKTAIVKDAVFYRQLPAPTGYDFDWKTYYIIKNLIAMDVLHGNFSVRLLRPFAYTLVWLFRCKNFNDIKVVLRALKDAYFYKSEN